MQAHKNEISAELRQIFSMLKIEPQSPAIWEGKLVGVRAIPTSNDNGGIFNLLVTVFPMSPLFEADELQIRGALEGFKNALADSDWHVRVSAVRRLGLLGHPAAVPALREALKQDSSDWVRRTAEQALKNLEVPGVYPESLVGLTLILNGKVDEKLFVMPREEQTDKRGQAIFNGLPNGVYNLRLATPRFGRCDVSPSILVASQAMAAATPQKEEHPKPVIFQSEDRKIVATLRITEHDETILAFETKAEELAETVVSFAFVGRDTRKVIRSGEVKLQPTDEPGIWEGRCSLGYKLRAPEPCEIMFDVSPLA
jgi:hypothetical protein